MRVSYFGKIKENSFALLGEKNGVPVAKAILEVSFRKSGQLQTIENEVIATGPRVVHLKAAENARKPYLFQGDCSDNGQKNRFLLTCIGGHPVQGRLSKLTMDTASGTVDEFVLKATFTRSDTPDADGTFLVITQKHITEDVGMAALNGDAFVEFEGYVRMMTSRSGGTYYTSTSPADHPGVSKELLAQASQDLGLRIMPPKRQTEVEPTKPSDPLQNMRDANVRQQIADAVHGDVMYNPDATDVTSAASVTQKTDATPIQAEDRPDRDDGPEHYAGEDHIIMSIPF